MRIADRVVILELDAKAAEGPAFELMRDPKVRRVYLCA
jgi:ABC-type branched-subunit amino acid transport system ATPase component